MVGPKKMMIRAVSNTKPKIIPSIDPKNPPISVAKKFPTPDIVTKNV
jgi:hypothetical protein